jgi:hypothetical protein
MAKYLARNCPMCRNYFGVIIAESDEDKVQRIHAVCATCVYEIDWALIRS